MGNGKQFFCKNVRIVDGLTATWWIAVLECPQCNGSTVSLGHGPAIGGHSASRFSDDLLCDAGGVNLFIFNKFDEPDNFAWIDEFNTPAKILIISV